MNPARHSPAPANQGDALYPPRKKILLADDDTAVQVMLTRVLNEAGYEVDCANNGNEALARAKEGKIDLILLDLNMPGKDGWDTHAQLASEHPMLSVIIITGLPSQEFTELAGRTSALMEKPLDMPKLLLTIRDLTDEPPSTHAARLDRRPAEFRCFPPQPANGEEAARIHTMKPT